MHRPHILARLLLALAVPTVGALAAIGVAGAADGDSRPVQIVPASSSVEDVSGPCDEAEHANDPRCTGVVAPRTTAPTPTVGTTPTTVNGRSGVDISGPCDEAEHANDPRCTGVVAPRTTAPTPTTVNRRSGVDISGPCDEAEHANDPRCTGGVVTDDNRGPGSSGRGDDDRSDDDSGHGSDDGADDDHGSGGHGSDD
jgi:hypothetical protein